MKRQLRSFRVCAWVLGLLMLGMSSLANADPPSRIARIGYMSGAVSFNPAGDEEWVQASLNRPLTTGDRVWADARSRAEIQIGGAVVRMGSDTDLSILNLDDRIAQMQLTQGVLNFRVRHLAPDQTYEVDTPNLAVTVRQPGAYRIEVDPDGNATSIYVRSGQVDVYGEGASYVIDSRQPYRFTGTGLRDYEYVGVPPPDDFDRWASDRDRYYDSSASARYVSPEVVGYQDLDTYGTWREEPNYGHVWFPSRVSVDWAPYRDGHWAWIEPWGWTWVDDAPWGFAVSHYGRWARVYDRWCWVPGPVQVRPYYAPALVAFIGGPNFQISISTGLVGGVAWFPLGPREVYRPAYAVSRNYFESVNVSNTVINTTVINNYYNNTNVTNIVYANQRVPGAVVAVPTQTFVQSKPVAREAVHVAQDKLVARPVAIAPAVVPTEKSVRGPAGQGGKPPAKAIERTVVAREAPPAARSKFEPSKQDVANRGQPSEEDTRRDIRPAAPVQKPNVKVIAQKPDERPTAAPPPVAKGAKPRDTNADETRGREDDRKGPPSRDSANAPSGAPAPQAPAPRGKPEAPGRDEQRAQPDTASPRPGSPEQRARGEERGGQSDQARPPAAAPAPPSQAARPAPAPRPPETRGGPEQRDRADQRERPDPRDRGQQRERADQRDKFEQPDRPDQRAQPLPRPPAASSPQSARPAPAPQPEEPRGRPEQRDRDQSTARPSPPQAARPAPVPQPQEPRGRPEPRDRTDQSSARPSPPQARTSPPRQDEPRPRAEAPQPPAETPRPPGAQQLPPPVARPAEPSRPNGEARPQPRPAPNAAPPDQERRSPQPRPNDRKKNERDDEKK